MVSTENVSGLKILEKCVIILKHFVKTLNVENCCLRTKIFEQKMPFYLGRFFLCNRGNVYVGPFKIIYLWCNFVPSEHLLILLYF